MTPAGEAFLRLWVVMWEEVVEPFLPLVEQVSKGEVPPHTPRRGRPRMDEAVPRARVEVEESTRALLRAVGIGPQTAAAG